MINFNDIERQLTMAEKKIEDYCIQILYVKIGIILICIAVLVTAIILI